MARLYQQHPLSTLQSPPPRQQNALPGVTQGAEQCHKGHRGCHTHRAGWQQGSCPACSPRRTHFATGRCLPPPPALHRHSLHPAGLFIISICSCLSLLRDTNSKHPSPARTCRSQPQPAGDSGSGGAAPCSGGSCTPPVPGGPLGARAGVARGGDTQGVTGARGVARPAWGWAGETGSVCSPCREGQRWLGEMLPAGPQDGHWDGHS